MANRNTANALALAPLALGLMQFAVQPGSTPKAEAVREAKTVCEVADLAACPVSGCADPKSDPAHALVNQMKRHKPTGPMVDLVFADFLNLQKQADKLV